jgi:hypothetical protein
VWSDGSEVWIIIVSSVEVTKLICAPVYMHASIETPDTAQPQSNSMNLEASRLDLKLPPITMIAPTFEQICPEETVADVNSLRSRTLVA